MEIEFCIEKIDSFLPQIARQLGLQIVNSSFNIPEEQGRGLFNQIQLCDDLIVTYYELLLNEESIIVRKRSVNDNIIPIVCWLTDSSIEQELNCERKRVGKCTPNGIFMPANSLETKYTFPKGEAIKNITFFITKDWLKNIINENNNYLANLFLSKENFFIYEEIDYDISELLIKIENLVNESHQPLAKLCMYAQTLSFIHLFFNKIITRPIERQLINITPRDIQALFRVKHILINEYISIPSTLNLSKECGLSVRKLQRLFRQVFGKSIYKYAMDIKMNEAKKLLASKKFSVSEVGYKVGYSNLSHFTIKFKSTFGLSPKTFLSSLT